MKSLSIATYILVLLFLLLTFSSYIDHTVIFSASFDSDEYLHAAPALDLSQFLNRGDWGGFFERLQREVFYPPLHSLILSFVYYFFEPTIYSSRFLSYLFFLAATFVTVQALCRVFRETIPQNISASIAVLFATICPIALFISLLVMLEPLGMLLVALFLYSFTLREKSRWYSFILSSGVLTAMLLTKHTFGLLVIPGFVLAILSSFDLKDQQFKRNLFWMTGVLLVAGMFGLFWIFSVDTKALNRFVFNHHARGYGFGIDANTFYFQSLLLDFHITWLVGLTGLSLAVSALFHLWNNLAVRLSFFSLLVSFIAFGFLSERGPRHVVILAPYWWFLVGCGATTLFQNKEILTNWKKYLQVLLPTCIALSTMYFSFVNSGWYGETLSLYIEEKPNQDIAIKKLMNQIPKGKHFFIADIDRLAFPYHLLWEVAARDGLTMPEVNKLHIKKLPEDKKDIIQITNLKEMLLGENK